MANRNRPDSSPWRRTAAARRLLVIEHPDGTVEDRGFVQILTLVQASNDDDPEIVTAIEWKDPETGPRTLVLHEDDYIEGKLKNSLTYTREDGVFEIWHVDEAALEAKGKAA